MNAIFWLMMLPLFLSADAVSEDLHPVLTPETSSRLNDVFGNRKTAAIPGGWSLESLEIQEDRATLRFRKGKRRCILDLRHPSFSGEDSKPNAATSEVAGPFSVSFPDEKPCLPARTLKDVHARLKALDAGRIWSHAGTPTPPESWRSESLELAEALLDRGEIASARRILDAVGKMPEASPMFRAEHFWLKLRLTALEGRFDEAQRMLENLPDASDGDLRAFARRRVFETARLDILEGRFDDGLSRLSTLEESAQDPDGAPDIGGMRCLFLDRQADRLGKAHGLEKKIEFLSPALERFPNCASVRATLSEALLSRNETEKALKLAEEGVKSRPDSERFLAVYAAALRRAERYEDALDTFEKAYRISKNPRYIGLFSTVASMHGTDHRYRDCRKRQEADPKDLLLRHAVAVMGYYRGRFEETKRMMDALREELPQDDRVYIYGAMSRYALGDWEGARTWLDDLAALGPERDPDLYYCQAVLWHRKDRARSLEALDKYLSFSPGPDAYRPKRARAIEIRRELAAGKNVPEWDPSTHGCGQAANASGLLFLLCLALPFMARRKQLTIRQGGGNRRS